MDLPERNSPEHKTTRLTESELTEDSDFTATLQEWDLYRIERLLGTGGMARVYLAFDNRLNRYVALKFIRSDDEKLKVRLLREARAQAQIENDNVCKIYEANVIQGKPYIAMQYINGKNLDAISSNFSFEQRVDALQRIASAVHAAHQLGIIHCDIKPSNIMMEERKDGSFRPYILDFGIARDLEEPGITVGERVIGTPSYMAPEVAAGGAADHRSDIYSLGATLYEVVSGRAPFEGANSLEILNKVLHDEPLPPQQRNPKIPKDLETIILKSMQKEPEKRYASAGMLAQDLNRYQNGESILAKRALWINHAARKIKHIQGTFLIAAMALVVFAALMLLRNGSAEKKIHPKAIQSIAVLPFAETDKNYEYVGDGITEGVINHLSQIPALKVMAQDTVFTYKGKQPDPRKVAHDLNVDAIVSSSQQRQGDWLIVRTHLINGVDGAQIWAGEFTRKLTDLATMPPEIASQIAANLTSSLKTEDRQRIFKYPTENSAAYLHYLKGRYFWYRRSEEDNKRALPYFQLAIKEDPNYALAHAFVANTYEQAGINGWMAPKDAFPKVKVEALKALEIDSRLSEAHVALAGAMMFYDFNWPDAQKELDQAVGLNPNDAHAHRSYAYYLAAMHRTEDAIREMKAAEELDPLSVSILEDIGWMFVFARQYDQALNQANAIIEMDANDWSAYLLRGEAYLHKKRLDQALKDFQTGVKLSNRDQYALADLGYVYAAMGKRKEALAVVDELSDLRKRRYVSPIYFAVVFCNLRETDRAFEWLDQVYQERGNANVIWLNIDPWWDPMRSDPRFVNLLRRMHLPA